MAKRGRGEFCQWHPIFRTASQSQLGLPGGRQLCERLLDAIGVAMLPGVDFGRPASELTARLSYFDFDGARALAAAEFSAHDQPLSEDVVVEYCPQVLQAVDRICEWLAS